MWPLGEDVHWVGGSGDRVFWGKFSFLNWWDSVTLRGRLMRNSVCHLYKERTSHKRVHKYPKRPPHFQLLTQNCVFFLCFIYKLNSSLLHTPKKFLLYIVSGFFYEDNLINRLSSKLISCGNEARGTGVSTPEDFAIPADSQARLIISQ